MICGVDGKKIRVRHRDDSYSSCLGVTVKFERSLREFKKLYDAAIEQAKKKENLDLSRNIYKSKDIMGQFGPHEQSATNFLATFTSELLSNEDVSLGVTFTDFELDEIPERDGNRTIFYYRGTEREEEVGYHAYIEHLSQFYPQVTAFTSLDTEGREVYLDNISHHNTKSWDALVNNQDVTVVPNGDKTNPLVSSADLITRYIDNFLTLNKEFITKKQIARAISLTDSNDFLVERVSNRSLGYIVPRKRDHVPLYRYYPNKMVYILLENEFKGENSLFEESEYYEKACEQAHKNNSGLKVLVPEDETHITSQQDLLVYTGENTKEIAERFSKFGKGNPVPIENLDLV